MQLRKENMTPTIPKTKKKFLLKKCQVCENSLGPDSYIKVKSIFFPDGYLPICNDCIKQILAADDFNWKTVNKLCQYADLPFVPIEFERLHEINGDDVFPVYAGIFLAAEYDDLGWGDYFEEFKRIKEANLIEEELPEIREAKYDKLKKKWGASYDEEALNYLEFLYNGITSSQNINGAIPSDLALKICKISYEIDACIRSGESFDKLLNAYDKFVKIADFTPQNAKSNGDFDTTGELFRWLEKRGWKNKYYDGATRDMVDETIKNIQSYNRQLYINETGIGEEITQRLENLKSAAELENYYGLEQQFDEDYYEIEAEEEFTADIESYE